MVTAGMAVLLMLGMLTAFALGMMAGGGGRPPAGPAGKAVWREEENRREQVIFENIENYGTARGQREVE